jgi:rhodanese-related sulfurtransferase
VSGPSARLRATGAVEGDSLHGGENGGAVSRVGKLLAAVRARLDRPDPRRAAEMVAHGAYLVDTRPGWQRDAEGELPGALVIERNHVEWRLDPTSDARIPQAVDDGVTWIIVCSEGYSSSLAAASLHDLGLRNATDLDGGYQAWKAAGLPTA